MTHRPRQSERGYALIFVFAMSAMMAMMLYMEMPRLALEMQRNREELLIERGEQYARAIKVFSKKNKKWPQTIEELESFNGVRFLRRRYKDPMTGKDEWRLIHIDAQNRLTDSLVQKPTVPGQTTDQKSTNTFVSEGPTVGSTGDANSQRVAQALNRRASEQPGAAGAPPSPSDPSPGGVNPVSDPLQQQQYQQQQMQQQILQQQQQSMVPIMGPNGQPIQRIPGLPGQMGTGSPYPNQAANSQTGGTATTGSGYSSFGSGYSGSTNSTNQTVGPQPNSPQQGSFRPGGGNNSFGGGQVVGGPPIPGSPGGGVNPATTMIQQILTRPNPQGLANIQGGLGGTQAMGGGIAGVASKFDAEGIKIYKEKTNYKEWEFIYDPTKELKNAMGQQQGNMNGQIPGLGSNGSSNQQGTGFGGQQGGLGGQQGGFGGTRR